MPHSDDEIEHLVDTLDDVGVGLLQQRDRLVSLERLLHTGLMLLGSDGHIRLANERARQLLRLDERDGASVTALVEKLLATTQNDAVSDVEVDIDGRSLQATITVCEDGASRLVEVRDRQALARVENDLMMAARVRNLTRLYVGLTHDLKAPLNAIMLHLEMLRRALGNSSDEGSSMSPLARVDIVESELQRLERSLELMLGQTAPAREDIESFDLRDVVTELGDLLRALARQSAKSVETALPDHAAMTEMNRDHVRQALLNVAINGLEAMPENGRLMLRLIHGGDRLRVEISDTGPGVDAELRDQLFNIYASSKSSGLGVGLFFARTLLEAQGGTLELSATSPRGSTFTATLPAVEKA